MPSKPDDFPEFDSLSEFEMERLSNSFYFMIETRF
jgi:hypothetical protein